MRDFLLLLAMILILLNATVNVGQSLQLRKHKTQDNSAVSPHRATGAGRVPLLAAPPDFRPYRRLFDAIHIEELAGRAIVPGDEGMSRGPYQISRAYWQDACEYGNLGWSYDKWVNDKDHCEYVMWLYWLRHGATTDEERARMHHGGPTGPSKASTRAYWQRVKALMETP